ncbi:hypothetical protein PILCRDRAFT_88004 [Piloderma croceum F 1598]|uniref:Uncharacterized protein n=1 Tax=Piloderma croceum (strain F 1598) TaxID=765440 RepID=A0A0C3FVQ7_PILCF|nr:hypothetical protein PILCRDRAFT_88004 [Piloderma croceum F 1598]
MDLMDVDRPEDLSSSLPSSLKSQHIKDILSQGQLTTLNDRMTLASQIWQNSNVVAEGDDSQLRLLIKIVFTLLTSALKDTAIKDNVITAQLAEELAESFNEDKLKHSKVVVHNCVEKKDWVDLICIGIAFNRNHSGTHNSNEAKCSLHPSLFVKIVGPRGSHHLECLEHRI